MSVYDLQTIFDQSKDIIAVLDLDLRYVMANLEYCRYWSKERDEVLGTHLVDVIGEKPFDSLVQGCMQRCVKGEVVHFEKWLDFPAVGRRFMDVKYTPYRDESDTIIGVCLMSRDATERMEYIEAVKNERNKFDGILTSLNLGVALYNPNLTIQWANRFMYEMYPCQDMVGHKCHEMFWGKKHTCDDCPALKSLESGETHSVERYVDNQDRWISLTSIPIKNDRGEIVQILAHVVDITEKKWSLNKLEAREAELASIFRTTQVGIGVVKDRVVLQGNDYFFSMLGYERNELLGQNVREIYSTQEEYDYVGFSGYAKMEEETTATMETQLVCKDGSLRDAMITITPLIPGQPEAGVTFVGMDITDFKRADKALHQSEQRFKQLFEDVNMIAVQGYDHSRHVVYWNPASEHMYGFTREEAMGQLLENLIIPDFMQDAVKQGHAAWVNDGVAIPAGELDLTHKDGHLVRVYSSHVMQETASGEKIMYCLDVDLTEIKRIHSQLVLAKEEAEFANKAKSEFLANMSHEIRTPLNGIQGMLTLMQGTNLDSVQREYAQAGVESAVRLNRLLSDILDISRVEAGMMDVEYVPFNLHEAVQHVGTMFKLSFEEAQIHLHCSVADDVPEYVVGDSARLQQVLTNLVGNALKFTESGEVRVEVSLLPSVSEGTHRVYFSVSDTGIGISDDKLKTLFEPFVQGSQGYARKYQGAGLGLSICKRLMSLMNGHMAMESVLGQGSTVHMVVTFGEKKSQDTSDSPYLTQNDGLSFGLNVLLAEDDNVNRMVGQRQLEKAGCMVSIASNGVEAIEKLRKQQFDAVYMDIQMPEMDGVDATRCVRAGVAGVENRDVPIFALTAYSMIGDKAKFMNVGMDDYIPKPMEVEDLLRTLHLAMQKKYGTGDEPAP
ncbi:PAS domain-containing hybrid sensor histidine kinase/response regulator [Pseudodesulfovibrio sediminis]|uniref:histidine kinase n=1 Tax=Pseudodesulfovibrio sediminis TaxID=2810563 RepID=A0ABN6EVR3_9BACT|nr:PAS domain S-box protein [Pseudodesulfovibrio sediminis]BCS89598.1 hypothetical protein PSDVSF_28400 [Pseudodesulfovibrio sediminis]